MNKPLRFSGIISQQQGQTPDYEKMEHWIEQSTHQSLGDGWILVQPVRLWQKQSVFSQTGLHETEFLER
jgi:hypothetical protein